MEEKIYAKDRPKSCDICYFWRGKSKGCSLRWENCYYLLPDRRPEKEVSECNGCPYGRVHPCIGYCMKNLMNKERAGDAKG